MIFDSQFAPQKAPSRGISWKRASLACVCIFAIGCDESPPLYPVSGTITFNGETVSDGFISFIHQDGRTTPRGTKILEGKYSEKLTVGPHKVRIEASKFVGPEDKVMGLRPRDQYLPDKYNVETELTIDVKPDGDNLFDFALTE